MKPLYSFPYPVILLMAVFVSACRPLIYYIGDKYPASSSVDVYYDARQIKKEYKTIGRMTHSLVIPTERDKRWMIEEAKRKGADGIIFSDLSIDQEHKSEQVTVKAELIKYL